MRVVRIFGAAYSGSTALGYVLNTNDGYFFGSETYRLLQQFQDRRKRLTGDYKYPVCDMCGHGCPHWTPALLREIRARRADSLELVYAAFSRHNPAVEVYVDGTKLLRFYDLVSPGKNLVSVKHPLRMLASSAYNDGPKIGFATRTFEAMRLEISRDRQEFLIYAAKYFNKLIRTYDQILTQVPDRHVCRVDAMHENDMEGFQTLSGYLGLAAKLDPRDFSRFPVHTLGGNRAPLWMAQERQQGKTVDHPRRKYYESAQSIGDWSLDDKHALLFDPDTRRDILGLAAYRTACALLEYDPDETRPREAAIVTQPV
jgi:hypothetical protein